MIGYRLQHDAPCDGRVIGQAQRLQPGWERAEGRKYPPWFWRRRLRRRRRRRRRRQMGVTLCFISSVPLANEYLVEDS